MGKLLVRAAAAAAARTRTHPLLKSTGSALIESYSFPFPPGLSSTLLASILLACTFKFTVALSSTAPLPPPPPPTPRPPPPVAGSTSRKTETFHPPLSVSLYRPKIDPASSVVVSFSATITPAIHRTPAKLGHFRNQVTARIDRWIFTKLLLAVGIIIIIF